MEIAYKNFKQLLEDKYDPGSKEKHTIWRNGWYKKDQIELQELKNKTSDVKIPLMALTAD